MILWSRDFYVFCLLLINETRSATSSTQQVHQILIPPKSTPNQRIVATIFLLKRLISIPESQAMVATRATSPATEQTSAISPPPSSPLPQNQQQQQQHHRCQARALEPAMSMLLTGGENSSVGVSNSRKRQHKDKWVYVNTRTGLPVRPPTSFGLFKHALRRTISDKVDFFNFNRQATDAWAQMSDNQKEPYVRRAKQLSEQFKKIEAQYLRRKVRELQREVKHFRRSSSSRQSSSSS